MKATEYLQKELKVIADKFPNVNIRYGYDKIINTHIVELLPLIEYHSNEDLDNAWIPLSISFLEKYMDEEIAFISSDSSLSPVSVIFEFNPKACTEENIIPELFEQLTKNSLKYTFFTEIPQHVTMQDSGIKFFDFTAKNTLTDDNDDSEMYYLDAA